MKHTKYILITLVIIMVAVVAFSVNTALAVGSDRPAPVPENHAPVCYKVETFAPGVAELQCYDTGKDIANVSVKTNVKYELTWDSETVTLIVYAGEKGAVAMWVVQDKAGNTTFGRLP